MGYDFHYLKGPHAGRVARLQRRVVALIKNLDWQDDKIDVSADWFLIHLITASQMARVLAMRRGQDSEIAAAAGILHDIGLLVNAGMEKTHAHNGREKAVEILHATGEYHDDEIELIANAVAKHSEKDKTGNWLEELMKDVDVLDCTLHGSDFSDHQYHFARWQKVKKELSI